MASSGLRNGHTSSLGMVPAMERFTHVKPSIEVPIISRGTDEVVELDLEDLSETDPGPLCILLDDEHAPGSQWMTVAMAYAKCENSDAAIEVINKGIASLRKDSSTEQLHLYNCLCWLYMLKSRQVPRVKIDGTSDPETKFKEHYLRATTATLNEASRLNPKFPPLSLARGVLCLLRAALLQDQTEKVETLKQAVKAFDDALRYSKDRNMMAMLGRSRAQFSLGKYPDALRGYQTILQRAPLLTDPDPRIGIGCCFWALGHKDDAKTAWQRALELNPTSKVANVLTGLYYLNASSQYSTNDPQFASLYRKAITDYTQQAFRLDNDLPLACATFGSYFLLRKAMPKAQTLSRKAIELTDINAIASDAWYILARGEHYAEDNAKAADYYSKADQARGGDDRGYAPAKFGAAQLRVLLEDFDGAKFRLEKMIQQSRGAEAMSLLGALFAEDVFSNRTESAQEHASTMKKAIALLEAVRQSWKDASRISPPDTCVLLTLARLYESEFPDKALQCLQQIQQIDLEELGVNENKVEDPDEEATRVALLKEELSPQLLNNIGCFHYQAERYSEAQEHFQIALKACVERGKKEEEDFDTDALVTTVSFNLARTYETQHMLDEAKQVYEGLLQRHDDYIDAHIRLTYIALLQSPHDEGPKAMARLYETDSSNMEVRALHGWFLRKAKRKTLNINEDQEQRHFKHTLQGHDKHDRYALTGMGNLHLTMAREMPRETEPDKEKRKKYYERAVEFYDKAVQLDPRNAYAAQGIAIAMIEDRRDFPGALQIFSKVKDTVKDGSVHINLGHVYCELKQYSRAIESYETALAKDRGRDPQTLTCLGRAWLLRGKQEKKADAMRSALEYTQRALDLLPSQIHYRWNIAYLHFQLAQLLLTLPENARTLAELRQAATDLDSAIELLSSIAKSPAPPFPRQDIDQRANMGRNTMRKQLDRAVQKQAEYEELNKERLQKAREAREAELARRAEERRKAEEAQAEQERVIAEERERLLQRDREIAEQRAVEDEEERERAEEAKMRQKMRKASPEIDSEGNEVVKRKTKKSAKRKKKSEDFVVDTDSDGGLAETSGDDGTGTSGGRRTGDATETGTGTEGGRSEAEEDSRPKKKKRRLDRKSTGTSSSKAKKSHTRSSAKSKSTKDKGKQFKSSERIIDSDDDLDLPEAEDQDADNTLPLATPNSDTMMADPDDDVDDTTAPAAAGMFGDADDDEGDDTIPAAQLLRKRGGGKRVVDDEDEDEDTEQGLLDPDLGLDGAADGDGDGDADAVQMAAAAVGVAARQSAEE